MRDLRKKLLGKKGEDLAVEFLKKKGYQIIERNFSKRYGEIDIVAKDEDTLVFVEVKTRKSDTFGSGLEAITPWKLKTLVKSAHFYNLTHEEKPIDNVNMRIDVVSVKLSPAGEVVKIELVKNVTG